MVAATTYTENLTISTRLNLIGADASTTIIDGRHVNTNETAKPFAWTKSEVHQKRLKPCFTVQCAPGKQGQ
jgi:hypothetical protein